MSRWFIYTVLFGIFGLVMLLFPIIYRIRRKSDSFDSIDVEMFIGSGVSFVLALISLYILLFV